MNSDTRRLVKSAVISALVVAWVCAAVGMYGPVASVMAGYAAAFGITMAFVYAFLSINK